MAHHAKLCDRHAREHAHAVKNSQEKQPKKATFWAQVRRRADNEATENIGMRQACKRLKGIITGRPKPVLLKEAEAPLRVQLWQPLKRVWQKNSKSAQDGAPLYQHNSQRILSSDDRKRMGMPLRVTIEETDDPRSSEDSKPTDSQTSLLPRTLEALTIRPKLSQSALVCAPSSVALSTTATVGKSPPVERQGIHKELPELPVPTSVNESRPVETNQVPTVACDATIRAVSLPPSIPPSTPTVIEIEHPVQEQSPGSSEIQIVIRHEVTRSLPDSSSAADYHQSSLSSSSSSSPPPVQRRITPTERAEYDRIVRVFFRQHTTRIPIPTVWRSSVSRAYSFRDPTSPYRNVATAPVASSSTPALSTNPIFATEPWRHTPSPRHTTATPGADTTLRDIAARPAVRFPTPVHDETARPGSALNPAELPGSAVPSPPVPPRHPARKPASSLPVARGTFESEIFTSEPRKRRRVPDEHDGTAPARPQTAIPVRQTVNAHAVPARSRFARTIPQGKNTLAWSHCVAPEQSLRIPQFGRPSRARFLGPVVLDEGSAGGAESEGPARTPATSREEEISRRGADIRRKPSVRRSVTPGDDRASIMSGDEEWFEASHVAVVDESVQ